jgi:hypothetical protein
VATAVHIQLVALTVVARISLLLLGGSFAPMQDATARAAHLSALP